MTASLRRAGSDAIRRSGARSGSRALAGALLLLSLGAAAGAMDVLHLRGGQALEGEVVEETEEVVVFRVGRSTIRLDRARVLRIERGKTLPAWEVRLREKLEEDRRKREEAARAAAEKARAEKEEEGGKADDARLARLVEELADDDPETRREAAALLEREGAKAVPALTEALFHANAFAREAAAGLLGRLKARQSVRAMIIALRSAVPEKEKVRPWQRSFVRVLREAILATTGKDFGVSLYATNQGKVVDEYVAWWDGAGPAAGPDARPGAAAKGACMSWDTPQVGETPVAEDDPEREKKIREARRIGGERRTYSPPRAFAENPFGEALEE